MSATPPSSLQEKIAKLLATFIEQLPARMLEVRRLFEIVRQTPEAAAEARDLHRHCHSLKGTGATFGLTTLSAAASDAEKLLKQLVEEPSRAGQGLLIELEQRLVALEAAVQSTTAAHRLAPAKAAEPGYEMAAPQAEQTEMRSRLLYLCDDDRLQLEHLASQLACFGYETIPFTEIGQVRAAVARRRPDAILLDIVFPEGEGAGLKLASDLLGRSDPPIPVVFTSARRDFEARLQAVQAGGMAYFPKPVQPMDLVESLDALTARRQPEPLRVMLVDDEPAAGAYHGAILEEAGIVSRVVTDPAQVLDILTEFNPDLVLMDMYMPGCTGQDLARLIRQVPDHLSLPIVYLSTETDMEKQFSALEVGAEGFLTKPIPPERLVREVVLRAERMRILRSLMVRDSLTGLFNHTTIKQFLSKAVNNAVRSAGQVAFAMIDLDRFKLVNDSYGHPMGDQVLLALARLLQQRLRHSDIVGRYGGEEFAVILPDVTREGAVRLMDQLREDFAKVRFQVRKRTFSCTFSCGVAAFPEVRGAAALCEGADRALYRAKREGRDRVEAFLPDAAEAA